jgi:cytochrome c biogenesis protein CcmG/thiol:disulfide interchange protein DsbE
MPKSASQGQWTAVGIIVGLLAGALGVGLMLTADFPRVQPGFEAPDFNAVNLATGDTVTLADYEGDVVLLNVWATNCPPCRWEMPSMERLYDELGSEGLKVVAVSVDVVGSDEVLAFANELGLTFDVLHDRSGQIEFDYQTTGLPETVVIDRHGVIVHKVIGGVVWDEPVQKARFRRLLGIEDPEAAPAQAGSTGG